MKKQETFAFPNLEIGSNGYYFINGSSVSKQEFDREALRQAVIRIENKLDKLISLTHEKTKAIH